MQVWNSLEVAKLVADLITPLVVALVGYWITIRLKCLRVDVRVNGSVQKNKKRAREKGANFARFSRDFSPGFSNMKSDRQQSGFSNWLQSSTQLLVIDV